MNEEQDFDKRFVEKWVEAIRLGRNARWVADELRIGHNYTLNKAQTLRRRGVKLPNMRGGRYSITPDHVSDLNNLIGGDE